MYAISIEQAEELVQKFETGTLPKIEWTHEAHLIAGLKMFLTYKEKAFPEMKKRIIYFNESVGTINSESSGYHETLTVFWLWAIKQFCELKNITQFDVDAIDELIFYEPLSRRTLVEEYYSEAILLLPEARRRFIRPDEQPMVGVDYFLNY
ncbi:MAG: hypothetical protein JNL70_14695 [Saprospiraceae bacterium]|nr:hypothetical protein [Saprospiraceae bacterium]